MKSGNELDVARILIIDDDVNTLLINKKIFEVYEPAFVIDTIQYPLEVENYLKNNKPDLILTDWEMPNLTGIELIKLIREIPEFFNTPVIMTTGIMTSSENLLLALNSGANDFLRKPYEKTELVARVRSMVQLSAYIKKIESHSQIINEHNQFILSLISAVPAPLVYYNKAGIILTCNNIFKETFKTIKNEFIGSSVYQIFPNPLQIKLQTENMLINRTQQIQSECFFELSHIDKITFLITQTIYYNPLNEPEGVICVFSDISKIKETHKHNLEEKKRELVSSALRLIQMSEMNHKLIKDLEFLNEHVDPGGKETIKKLLSKYNMKSIESSWNEFEVRFNRVYEEFYLKLTELHPSVTPSEKKLSALLRLNLSSKDIATLLFQDAKSIDMARYRLRKKLNLLQDDNLVDYLMKI